MTVTSLAEWRNRIARRQSREQREARIQTLIEILLLDWMLPFVVILAFVATMLAAIGVLR